MRLLPPLRRTLPPLALLFAAACQSPTGADGGSGGALAVRSTDFSGAYRAVSQWTERHPAGWDLGVTTPARMTRTEWSQTCAATPASGMVVLKLRAGSTDIDLGFRCPIDRTAGIAELEANLAYVALNALPHGIAVSNWRFDVVPPVSSFREGVSFSRTPTGALQLRVETPLYGVFGTSTLRSCEPPADGPALPGCWLFREHRVPLRLRVTVPFDLSALG